MADAEIAGRPLLLIRDEAGLRAFDGVCPHRGARIGRGGKHVGDHVICPFHGHRIRLGAPKEPGTGLHLAEHPALEIGEMVFVRLGAAAGAPACGFAEAIADLKADHVFVHGFTMPLPVSPTLVIENAFDTAHFGPVHGVPQASRLRVEAFDPAANTPLTARGRFQAAASCWDSEPDGTPIAIDYQARAFAPGLIVSSQSAGNPYHFLVGATPDGRGGCVARVVLMLPRQPDASLPPMEHVDWLLAAMESQLAADRVIWEGLPPDPPRRLQPGEEAIAAFWAFCDHFPGSGGTG